jgi:hypothetical protein
MHEYGFVVVERVEQVNPHGSLGDQTVADTMRSPAWALAVMAASRHLWKLGPSSDVISDCLETGVL